MLNQRLHIIHMNDLHSNFDNMKKISTYIKKSKNKLTNSDDKLIIVDLGDHMDRFQMETEGTNGRINIEILNNMGVHIATIGNNEGLTFPKEILNEAYNAKNFNVVVCNLKDENTNKPPKWSTEYLIENINGLRIGWIGVTAQYETFYNLQGWKIEDPLIKIKKNVQIIKSKVDIIILLSHVGTKLDKRIAKEIPGIDVILGAHTHRFFENGIKVENSKALLCQVGIFGDYVGHLTIEYNRENKQIINIDEKTIAVQNYDDDEVIGQLIEKYRDIAKNNLSIKVGFLEKPLAISVEEESPLGNLLADGVKKWVNSEVAFINNGQILESLEEGIITKEIIHKICPSPINVCKVILTGKQIRDTLEQSLLEEFIYSETKGYGFRGKALGTLSISGISVQYNLANLPYNKVIDIYLNNSLMKDEQEYVVGTLDMFTFGGGYYLIKEGRNIEYFLPEFLRDILAFQLLDEKSIKESYNNRWNRQI